MSSTASATTAPPVITTPIATALLPSRPTSGDTIAAMGPFTRLFANVLGNGRWFDTYIANLTAPVSAGGK